MRELMREMAITEQEIARRKEWLEFTEQDVQNLRALDELAGTYADAFVEELYRHFLAFPETRAFFAEPRTLARVKSLQRAYFRRLTQGNYDAEYVEARLRVGAVHERIGLDVKWYLGAYAFYLRAFQQYILEAFHADPEKAFAYYASLQKLVFLDMGLAIDTYISRREATIREQQKQLQEQLARLRLLDAVVREVALHYDLHSIAQNACNFLSAHLAIDMCCLLLYDRSNETLEVVAMVGNGEVPSLYEVGLRAGGAFAMGASGLEGCTGGNTIYMPHTAQVAGALPQALARQGLRSLMAVPLLAEEKLIGILLAARLSEHGFSGSEGDFLAMLSEHLALVAQHARLYGELQAAYKELRQTHQVMLQQERLRMLGQLASGLAHDINNVLSPIVGFTELLLDDPDLSERARQFLEVINNATNDTVNIIARLHEFYRSREQQETLTPLNPALVIKQVIELARPRCNDLAQQQGIQVVVETDIASEVPLVLGNETEIREALLNLVLNALEAMPKGGTVTIRACTAMRVIGGTGNIPQSPTHVVFEVADTGVGMDEITRQRCLEPFFTTKGERGSGLGLATVYGIMQRHGGEIEIESELGKGTTMRLLFPLRSPAEGGIAAPVEAPPLPTPLRILYIDDDPLLLMVVKELLEQDKHTVQVADGGRAGVAAFRAAQERGEPFDVVITDLGMPQVDGREVASTVKRESPGTPVVLLTGWGRYVGQESDVLATMDWVLSKPPKLRELRRALAEVYKQAR
jgi:signal transduction histidine kinase/ActR/RegA family two-component response regulator